MKTIIAAIALLVTVSVNAQSDKYADAMKKNLSMFDSAKTHRIFKILLQHLKELVMQKKHSGFLIIMQGLPYQQWDGLIKTLTKMQMLKK